MACTQDEYVILDTLEIWSLGVVMLKNSLKLWKKYKSKSRGQYRKITQKVKTKVDEKKRDVQFVVGDYFMVHLNKYKLQKGVPTKL